jgi:hypothetical protein
MAIRVMAAIPSCFCFTVGFESELTNSGTGSNVCAADCWCVIGRHYLPFLIYSHANSTNHAAPSPAFRRVRV